MLSLVLAGLTVPPVQETDPFVLAYREACAAEDRDALAALWDEAPGRILVTFDADLEAGLATWEQSPDEPNEGAIAELHDRALWAAEVASDVTGHPIFADYASAFVGWTPDQKRSFRRGQQAHGRAMSALQGGQLEDAVAAGRECRELALPLGDWWGTAMGYTAEALALARLERWDEALVAAGHARNLYRDLGLLRSEYQSARILADASYALGRRSRARVALKAAIEIAAKVGDEQGQRAMKERLSQLRAR